MTTAEQIEETLKKEGFKVRVRKNRNKKIDIRKIGFDEDITIEDDRDIVGIVNDYLKDITNNLTFRNIKRTGKLMMDIIRWLRNKKKNE